jgi:hypothetical protein
VCLGVELIGIAARPVVLGRRGEVPQPLRRQLLGRAEPLLQRRQLVPRLLCPREHGLVGRVRRFQRGQPAVRRGQVGLHLLTADSQRGFVGDLLGEGVAQRREVVGEQS